MGKHCEPPNARSPLARRDQSGHSQMQRIQHIQHIQRTRRIQRTQRTHCWHCFRRLAADLSNAAYAACAATALGMPPGRQRGRESEARPLRTGQLGHTA